MHLPHKLDQLTNSLQQFALQQVDAHGGEVEDEDADGPLADADVVGLPRGGARGGGRVSAVHHFAQEVRREVVVAR